MERTEVSEERRHFPELRAGGKADRDLSLGRFSGSPSRFDPYFSERRREPREPRPVRREPAPDPVPKVQGRAGFGQRRGLEDHPDAFEKARLQSDRDQYRYQKTVPARRGADAGKPGPAGRDRKREGADIGFAQDPDADRLALVTEEGTAISEEFTLAICVKYILSGKTSGHRLVVSNLSTTKAIDDITHEMGGVSVRTRIGEVYVAEEIKKKKAIIGGEGNGGVIYPRVGYNRDSLAGIALVLDYMAKTKLPLSKIARELPQYHSAKKKIECTSQKEAEALIHKVKQIYKHEKLDLTEGVKVLFKEAWVHVRASNTEPIVRVIAEARTKKEAENLAEIILNI